MLKSCGRCWVGGCLQDFSVSPSHSGFYRRVEDPGSPKISSNDIFTQPLSATDFLRQNSSVSRSLTSIAGGFCWFEYRAWILKPLGETFKRSAKLVKCWLDQYITRSPVNCKIWIRLKTDPSAAGHLLRFESSHANWYDLVPSCCFNTNFITLPATLASIKHKQFIFSNCFNELNKSGHFVLVNCFKMLELKIEVMDIYLKWTW